MRIRPILLGVLVVALTMCAERLVFAQAASGFQPVTSSDAAHIVQAGFGVYNTDTTTSRSITSSYEIVTPFITGTSVSLRAYLYNSSTASSTCVAYAADLSNSSIPVTTGTGASTTTFGQTHIDFGVGTPNIDTYAISVVCTLSKSAGGGNNTTLWAVGPGV